MSFLVVASDSLESLLVLNKWPIRFRARYLVFVEFLVSAQLCRFLCNLEAQLRSKRLILIRICFVVIVGVWFEEVLLVVRLRLRLALRQLGFDQLPV